MIDINYICKTIGDLSGVPVRIFDGKKQVYFHFLFPLPYDPITIYLENLLCFDKNIGYFLTEEMSYYSILKWGETRIIIGPTRQVAETDQELHKLAFRLDIPQGETDSFLAAMKSIIHMPLEIILQILCMVYHVLTGEKLSIKEISIFDSEQNVLKSTTEKKRIEQNELMRDKEISPITHNTFAVEESLMNIISRGDTLALQVWLNNAPAVRGGTLATEQLRQRKNMFIVAATLASRAAIRGGLDQETAFGLSDRFIQACELLPSLDRIHNLQYHMIFEYTERVARIRKGKKPTELVIAVANYIQCHLSEAITVEKISKEFYLSRPYLSAKFKEESGKTLTDFILGEKTAEGKRLLCYSEKSITQISDYLGFSSPAHFTKVFKRYAGMPPKEYREKYHSLFTT